MLLKNCNRRYRRGAGLRTPAVASACAVSALLLCFLFIPRAADAARIEGAVRRADTGEGIAGVVVTDGLDVVESGPDGAFSIQGHDDADFVFAVVPEGYSLASPFYVPVRSGGDPVTAQILLDPDPQNQRGEFSFVVVTDVHVSKQSHLGLVKERLAGTINRLHPVPRFIFETGDLVIRRGAAEFALHRQYSGTFRFPYLTVPGNHDTLADPARPWAAYQKFYGPPYYAFQYGGATFLCLAWAWNDDDLLRQINWLRRLPPRIFRDRPVILFHHAWIMWKDRLGELLSALSDYDIRAAFEGHWHMMRTYELGGIPTFLGTSGRDNLRDLAPPGFRVVSVNETGELKTTWRMGGIERRIVIISPGRETTEGTIPVVVNAYDSALPVEEVTVSFTHPDGKVETFGLESAGGWTWRGEWRVAASRVRMTVAVRDSSGEVWSKDQEVLVRHGRRAAPSPTTDWPHFRSNPARTGEAASAVSPPLHLSWVHSTGQTFGINSPVVADGKVYVGMQDDENAGTPDAGLLCLDARTGRPLWRTCMKNRSIRSTPSVTDGVVAALADDGTAFLIRGGEPLREWTAPEAVTAMYNASPLLDGEALFAGCGAHLSRMPAGGGAPLWTWRETATRMRGFIQPSPALAGRTVLIGWEGITALDVDSGAVKWTWHKQARTPDGVVEFREVCATPAVVGGRVVWVTARDTYLLVSDLASGNVIWSKKLGGWAGMASPAVSNGRIYAIGEAAVHAFDLATGREIWTTQIEGRSRAFSSPALSGNHLYFGTESGFLCALDVRDGRLAWRREIGAPVQGSPAVAGNSLYVTARDGSLYCFTGNE